jgi:hypothetical protein
MTISIPCAVPALAFALAALSPAPAAAAEADRSDAIAGGTSITSNLDFFGFTGLSGFRAGSGLAWLTYAGSSYGCGNAAPGGGRRQLFYPFTLPEENRNQFVRVWGFKAGGTPDVVVSAVRSCMSQAQSVPSTVTLDSVTFPGSPGEFSTFLNLDEEPVPLDCRYWVSLSFGDSSATCTNAADSLRLTRVRVQSEPFDRIYRSGFHNNTP